jgi:hypothetical protein
MNTDTHHHQAVHIFVTRGKDKIRLDFTTDRATGLEIKTRAGSGSADGLYRQEHGHAVEILDDEVVRLKDGEHFTIVPNGKVS